MLVQDILDLAKIKLGNLAISRNNSALIKMIYLGEAELFRRFNLSWYRYFKWTLSWAWSK